VSGDDRRALLELQYLTQAGDVVGERRQRELGCRDVEAVGLQPLDDGTPARTIGPGAVDEDDVGSVFMYEFSLWG